MTAPDWDALEREWLDATPPAGHPLIHGIFQRLPDRLAPFLAAAPRSGEGLDPERLARAMARCAEVGPPAHINPDDAEEHWPSYLAEAEEYAAEYVRLRENTNAG